MTKAVLPNADSRRYKIVLSVAKSGPIVFEAFFLAGGSGYSFSYRAPLRKEMEQLVLKGCLDHDSQTDEYSLTQAALDELYGVDIEPEAKAEIVRPMYRPKFKPLDLSRIPSIHGPRATAGQQQARRSFFTSGTSIQPFLEQRY